MNAVTACLCPDIDHRVAGTCRRRTENAVAVRQPDRHRIDQDVAVIGRVEIGFATNGRDADTVAVSPDARDDTCQKMAGLFMVRRAKAKGVQQCHRSRAHGEDIAKDAADSGCRALIGFDEGRVVVALNLEDGGKPVTNIDGTGILAGTLNHLWSVNGQGLRPFF